MFLDLRPIDILLKSLRSDTNHSNNLKRSFDSESQVFAYRLTHAQSTLSFSADKIFTKCTFFPEEFSFFITFKYEPDNLSSTGSSRNSQCIFSLRHPRKKATLIALEINNNHFVLTYNNTRKKFFDVRLSESKWHSVSLSLSEDGAYLVLDCSEEQKRKVRRTFPAMLDTRGSEFQLGKCSRKSFPFQVRTFKDIFFQETNRFFPNIGEIEIFTNLKISDFMNVFFFFFLSWIGIRSS